MFALLTQAQFASGLGTENDWLLTSASDDTLLSHSARHQKKEKDAKLREMGIPDHLTCLLRNLYAGQEATVRTGHGTTEWFQIGKAWWPTVQRVAESDTPEHA